MSKRLVGRIAAIAAVVVLVARRSPSSGRRGGTAACPARTASCPTAPTSTEADPSRANHEGHDIGGGTSVADLHGPSEGRPDARFELTAQSCRHPPLVGPHRPRADLQRDLAWPGAPRPAGRPRGGRAPQRRRRARASRSTGTASTCRTPRTASPASRRTPSCRAQSYTYRFRADQVGTFWYHTHQVSSQEVRRGLFGVIVIEPRDRQPGARHRVSPRTRSRGSRR